MEIKTNAAFELKQAEELFKIFAAIEEKAEKIKNSIVFYNTAEVAELTGLSKPKVLELFSRPDFPVCDYGNGYIVFAPALYEYFMKPVKKSDFNQGD